MGKWRSIPSKSSRPSSGGFSLIELLLVLGVLAILLVAAFVIYPQVRDRNQANAEAVNIRAIQAGVRTLFQSKPGLYNGLGNGKSASDRGIANQARIFPATMNGGDYSANAEIRTPWGGEVWVWQRPAVTLPTGSFAQGRTFAILYEEVPRALCLPILTAVASNFQSVTVSNRETLTAQGFDVNVAASACQSESGTVNLMFTSN